MRLKTPPSPNEEFYSSWQTWARSLVSYLKVEAEQQQAEAKYQLPVHFATDLPSAYTPGLLIYITDESKAAISTSTGGWKRLRFVT